MGCPEKRYVINVKLRPHAYLILILFSLLNLLSDINMELITMFIIS